MQPTEIFHKIVADPKLRELEHGKANNPHARWNQLYVDVVDDQHNVYRVSIERLN